MRSPLEVSSMGVMFSVHGDSVRPILPPRTFSVGFEEEIVPGVMFFTFTDPKMVVKSLFPILYFNHYSHRETYLKSYIHPLDTQFGNLQ